MRVWRRRYYDLFSLIYDVIIALHSRDKSARLRRFLLEKAGLIQGQRLLDICTGTGAVALRAGRLLGGAGLAVGVDFSWGMLKKASQKAWENNVQANFVLADVSRLPFQNARFDVVTCSHAMYELDPATRQAALLEVRRVLVPGGVFIMMEHMEPSNPLIRLLYNIRLASMGSSENKEFARDERPFLSQYFDDVVLEVAPGGRSKIIRGISPPRDSENMS